MDAKGKKIFKIHKRQATSLISSWLFWLFAAMLPRLARSMVPHIYEAKRN
jgi:hypothetical protein